MAVSILKRPLGLFISTTEVSVSILNVTSIFPGKAAFLKINHGLSTGDYIYAKTDVADYNGFWYVVKIDTDYFYVREYPSADYADFVRATTNAIYRPWANSHNWNCVHLPIVYKLSNTFWPTNSEDTARDITNVTDSNGYCNITASGDIKNTGSAAALEYVKITGCTDEDLNTVWQIITYSSDTSFVLDIPYSAATDTDLTNNATIQYYYNNYCTKVQVWGGLNNAHVYYGQKPYDLLATLELIPDENNQCVFSVHEILKEHINIENNLLLGTLPNNLDAFTLFFIKYGEEYDDSDGTTLGRSTVSYASDLTGFEGRAVNSILPFKSMHSGSLSEYILSSFFNGMFLTNFETPVIFSGQFFDIGFLWDGVRDIVLKKEWYNSSNVLQLTEYSNQVNAFYTGVYRAEVEENCTYPRLDITAYDVDTVTTPAPSTWTDSAASAAFDTKTATQFTITDGIIQSYGAYHSLPVTQGYRVTFTVTVSWGGTIGGFIIAQLMGPAEVGIYATQSTPITSASQSVTFNLTPSSNSAILRLTVSVTNAAATAIAVTMPAQMIIISNVAISETKTLDIDCTCLPEKATGFNMSWQNNLGHFDYWYFMAYTDHIIDITESEEGEENIFPEWPNSYGEFADTSNRKQTSRVSRKQAVIRAENVTLDQLQAIQFIKTSPLVQIVNSIYDRRTVIVDSESFTVYREGQTEAYSITVTITYTDDLPSQKV